VPAPKTFRYEYTSMTSTSETQRFAALAFWGLGESALRLVTIGILIILCAAAATAGAIGLTFIGEASGSLARSYDTAAIAQLTPAVSPAPAAGTRLAPGRALHLGKVSK
jgi:hypothetical protein